MKPRRSRKNQRNYYRILYVQPDAPPEIIQASYRTLMQKLRAHPDLGGDAWNASVINHAYHVLNNPERRRAYDKALFGHSSWAQLARQNPSQRRPAASPDWQDFEPIRL